MRDSGGACKQGRPGLLDTDRKEAVEDKVVGMCAGCANAFGATEDVKTAGLPLVQQMEVPGTPGFIDLSQYLEDGYQIITF